MWRRLLWFWPLVLAIPVAIGVVIHTNQSTDRSGGGGWLVTGLFSYTLYYFALTWPVWLVRMSQTRRMVISSLVPGVLLLILAVLPLPRRVPFLDVTVRVASFGVWFMPGEALYGKLTGFAFASPCEVSLWEAGQHGFSTEVLGVTYQPDGRILIQGFISKEGTRKNGMKLSRLLPDGSIDPTFKGQDRCSSLTPTHPGHVWLQSDGKILLGSGSISSSPNHKDELALIVSPEGEELRRVSIPNLPAEQHVEGLVAEVQLQSDGGLLMYGGFRREADSKSGSPILRITPEGLPDLSSWREMPELGVADSIPGAIGADGRRFIVADNPEYAESLLPAVYSISAEGQPDEVFHERLLGMQREKELRQATALAVQADGKLVTAFVTGEARSEVMRLNPDGTLDDTFQREELPFEANHLSALADGGFIVARVGLLNAFEERTPVVLARLDSNGRVDRAVAERFRSAFAAQGISSILKLTVGPNGTVLLYRFAPASAGGKTFHQLVQLLPDGSLDTGFHPPL
ncbi:delta-60 repeat domain-containing protein [Cystobacter fuscus]|uniref:Delta-60 repeat domain-containing protein n=1 Tax=Cystobacter fuscus TaxID=43 RepID=A0A250JJ59_9BACT|nr:delta-60 repeat domain-containing protein [Cystobacter fuscus]